MLSFAITKNHLLWAFLPLLLFKALWDETQWHLHVFRQISVSSKIGAVMGNEILSWISGVICLCLQAKGLCSFYIDLTSLTAYITHL